MLLQSALFPIPVTTSTVLTGDKLLWLKSGWRTPTLLTALLASPYSLKWLKGLWLHETWYEATGLHVKTTSSSWYSCQAESVPWGPLQHSFGHAHSVSGAYIFSKHTMLFPFVHALSFMWKDFLDPYHAAPSELFSHLSRWAQMFSCLWNPFWLGAQLVTPSSGFHIT